VTGGKKTPAQTVMRVSRQWARRLPRDGKAWVRMFSVTVKYPGQPGRIAGEYPTRRAAAHAAAQLVASHGPDGERPVGVAVQEVVSAGPIIDRCRPLS